MPTYNNGQGVFQATYGIYNTIQAKLRKSIHPSYIIDL